MSTQLRAVAAGKTDVGLQRDHNEDSFLLMPEYGLFVVADGMGGHRAGDVASRLAIEAITEYFRAIGSDTTWPMQFDARLSEDENHMLASVRLANRKILERSARSREFHGMGTTVVGALFNPEQQRMIIAHVGDSRAYRIRDGFITQMTRDHSLFNDYLMAMPDLSEEQRSELPRNVITRALGMQEDVTIDIQPDEVREGDVYVLCSDGLSGMVEDDDIVAIVGSNDEMVSMCRRLVSRANENGGEDNVTAVVVRVEQDRNSTEPAKRQQLNTIPAAPLDSLDTPPASPVSSRGRPID
jgi:PPM family protein phosphatase